MLGVEIIFSIYTIYMLTAGIISLTDSSIKTIDDVLAKINTMSDINQSKIPLYLTTLIHAIYLMMVLLMFNTPIVSIFVVIEMFISIQITYLTVEYIEEGKHRNIIESISVYFFTRVFSIVFYIFVSVYYFMIYL